MTDERGAGPEQSESTALFQQLIPHYEVTWAETCSLTVAHDDLQAVIRSIIRTAPEAKITIEQVDMAPGQGYRS